MEDIRLTKNFSVLHCSAGEAMQLPPDRRAQFNQLYLLVFAKSPAFVEAMINFHSRMPGDSHYFFGVEKGIIVSFTHFSRHLSNSGISYALSGGSISHPASMGSFLPLFEYANKYMGSLTDLLMGFCNLKSVRIYTHPVFGWIRNPEFRQVKITGLVSDEPMQAVLTRVKTSPIQPPALQSTLFRRDEEFLAWRLSRIKNYKVLKNEGTGHLIIIKPFETGFDVVSILNYSTPDTYINELRCLFQHLTISKPGFTGLNLYLSFPGTETLLNSTFRTEPLAHERFLCFRPARGFTQPDNTFVEMIDSDTL